MWSWSHLIYSNMDLFFMLTIISQLVLLSIYTEINNKTSGKRTTPKGNCIFLSIVEWTNMAFKSELTARIMPMKKQKMISISITKTQTHYTNTWENQKCFSLGTKKAIVGFPMKPCTPLTDTHGHNTWNKSCEKDCLLLF